MSERFVMFITQNSSDGGLNHGFGDITTGKWYYTRDEKTGNEIISLLNDLNNENESLKTRVDSLYHEIENNIGSFKKNNRERLKLEKELEQFRNLADDYNIPFDKLYGAFEDCLEENEQLKSFIYGLTTKGTGRIDLANGYAYNIKAILTDFNIGDVE